MVVSFISYVEMRVPLTMTLGRLLPHNQVDYVEVESPLPLQPSQFPQAEYQKS
jgi:hypothetical protein